MADRKEDWELRSSSSGKLKKSSSVEILLGSHPTRGRLLATSPIFPHVTSHDMKGSGRPTSTGRADTLPPPSAPPSDTNASPPVQNGKVRDTVQPSSVPGNEDRGNRRDSDAVPGNDQVTVPVNTVPGQSKAVKPELTGSNSSLQRLLQNPSAFVPITAASVTAVPQAVAHPNPQHPSPLSRLKNLKDKGSHLPPLNTTPLPESPLSSPRGTPRTTPKGTPRNTPKGTPVIGKRGHVFSVSTPEVEPETGQPVQPFPFLPKEKKPVKECVSDPFDVRRKNKPSSEEEKKEAGEGEGEEEPVWQRRLSLLFVPPTEDELEPDKEPEETTRFIPIITRPYILRKQSVDSVESPPRNRKKEREDRVNKKKEKEASKKEREAREKLIKEQSQKRHSYSDFEEEIRRKREEERNRKKEEEKNRKREEEEERSRKKEEERIRVGEEEERLRKREEEERNRKREEERKRKEKEEEKKPITKFSRLRNSSLSDDPPSSSSSVGSSDEDIEHEEEGREHDDYISWDDTICSNRSAYFKKYYSQRGVIGKAAEAEDAEIGFSSPLGTSQNSLSSLIRERMGKKAPNQEKKTNQIGLVVLVVVLLVVIVVGVSLTHYFYHLHLLELSIFNRIKFYEGQRHLEVYDPTWKPVITLHMGTNLPKDSIPEDCTDYLHYLKDENYTLPHHGLDDDEYEEMVCLDWTSLAQLHLRKLYAAGSVQCYTVWWVALKHDFTLRDCLMPNTTDHQEMRNITWMGGGEMSSGGFPINRADVPPNKMVTGKLDRDPWGQILQRTWISDHATVLMLPARFSGRVSVNHEQDNQVCLEMHVTACTTDDANLSYTICSAPTITALSGYMHQRTVQERRIVGNAMPSFVNYSLKVLEEEEEETEGETHQVPVVVEDFTEEVVKRVEERLEHPVWIPWMTPDSPYLTQESVVHYVERLHRMLTNTNANTSNTNTLGHVLLPPSWQTRPGEMEFNPERFPDPVALSRTVKAKGFRLALTLHPFVSVDAPGFKAGMAEGLWVRQKNSLLPALARYDDWHPSVVTDFSNPRARRWYASQLKTLKKKYEVDRFHLQPADAHALPTYHNYHTPINGPDDTLVSFMASVSSVSPPISTEGAIMPPIPPIFVTMGSGDGSWNGLETLVPRALTLAMLGYPFIDVGPVGGLARAGHVPDRELYIRWIEAATFLPAMQMSVLPATYGQEVEKLAKQYQAIRKKLVLPRLKDKVHDALQNSTPLITPLAVLYPNDLEAAKVDDQWMLGNDLLVAPITHRGIRSRTFYLPKGIWKDGIDGRLRNGGRWVENYKVPLSKIPHFILKYVNDFER